MNEFRAAITGEIMKVDLFAVVVVIFSWSCAVTVSSNGSRFVHASNVFIARPLYPRIVISGRDDISWPPKNWTKMEPTSGRSQHHDFFYTGLFDGDEM